MHADLMRGSAPLLAITRGPVVENVVRGLAVVSDTQGRILASIGQPETLCYLRSVAKPFQVLPLLLSGAADHYGLTEEELAIASSSHSGEPYHQKLVLSLLKKGHVSTASLQCGPAYPFYAPLREKLKHRKRPPKPLYHNCSGKHAGLLLAAKYQKFPLSTYRELYHPIQQHVLKILAEISGYHEKDIAVGVDGCGVPTFGLPLVKIAQLYAHLGCPDALPYHYQKALGRIAGAMRRYPMAIGGTGRFDTDLMNVHPTLIAKTGADAVYAVSLPEPGWGFALKLESGRDDVLKSHVVIEALCQLKILKPKQWEGLKSHWLSAVRNNHHHAVGEVRPLFQWNAKAGASPHRASPRKERAQA